MHKSCGRD